MSVLDMSYHKMSETGGIEGETEDRGAGEEPPTDSPKKLNAQEKFIHLLYNDIVDIILTKWRNRTKSRKSGRSKSSIEDNDAVLRTVDSTKIVQVEFPNGNNYVGQVIEKRMEGNGVYRWNSGETYEGRFEKNSIEGRGHLRWKDHSWYEGEFHRGYRHGNGNLVSRGYGRFYIGKWHMGRKHGNGYSRYNNNDNDRYEGDWKMDLKHGNGYRVYENGARYIGQWEDGQRNGLGTMVWSNGDVYRGEWENGTMNGYGEYVWNGFLNESLSWPQENCYMGEWLNGMKHGTGVLKLNSLGGAKYSGNWYMDKKHGHGMIIGSSGAVTKGDPLFLEDILVPLQRPESTFYKEDQLFPTSAAKKSAKQAKYGEPRRTTVCDPLENVPVSFYIRRLLDPWNSIFKTDRSPINDTSSGKCKMCEDHSSCTCLYDDSTSSETRSTTVSSFDIASGSSEFCTKGSEELGNVVERSEEQFEEHWIRHCLTKHMKKLREVYKTYAELYCDDKEDAGQRNLSMGRIALWQLMRDCNLHSRGFSLIQFERYTAMNKSAFIEAPFYPFERVEFFQFVQALLEVSWHLYTKLGDIETENIRGRLAGGLHRLLVKDIFPNTGKIVGTVATTFRDLLPLYAVHQLYCDVGEPHTARQFLRASCIVKGSSDPKPLPCPIGETEPIPGHLFNGINAVTVGEKLSFIPAERPSTTGSPTSEVTKTVYDDELARELFALRHLGAPKMVSIMASICPGIKDEETEAIVNMDYELTFLEFYEILLEAARALIQVKKILAEEENRRATETAEAELAKAEADQVLSRSQSVQSSQTRSKRSTASKVPKSRKKVT